MFLELFRHKKPIMAMLHLKGDSPEQRLERAIVEADRGGRSGRFCPRVSGRRRWRWRGPREPP
jgi:hypothetical protein